MRSSEQDDLAEMENKNPDVQFMLEAQKFRVSQEQNAGSCEVD